MHKTLQQFLLHKLKNHPERYDLVLMMSDLATIGKLISAQTNRAGLAGITGLSGSTNVQDEDQAKLDIYANDLCKQYLSSTGLFAAMASEEEDEAVDLENPDGKYIIAFDPLDGSSNIDVNVAIGTIFSVHNKLPNVAADDARQFLQKGRDQILAGYILYGSSTVLVFSWGEGVHEFTLDVDLGEFLLSNEKMTVPDTCPYYSLNESYTPMMSQKDQDYLAEIKKTVGKQRWIGSLVADFHRNLIKGGIFFFPAIDQNGDGNFKPKLRLNYEAKPMAYLIQQAGGAAFGLDSEILDIVPEELHQRVPLIIGNKQQVNQYKEMK